MHRDETDPGVKLVGEANQVVGAGEESLNEDPEKAEQDGHLYHHGTQAPNRANSRFPVQSHRLLGHPGPVSPVALLNLPHSGLQQGHGPHLVELFQGEGQRHHAYQHGEHDDGESHVFEEDYIQHHQGVKHGADDNLVPE